MNATIKLIEKNWDYLGYQSLPEPNDYDTSKKWEFNLVEELENTIDELYTEILKIESGATKPDRFLYVHTDIFEFTKTLNRRNPTNNNLKHGFDINEDNTRQIESYCRDRGIEVAAKLPFDDVVTRAMVKGLPVVEFGDNQVGHQIELLWHRVASQLAKN